MDQRTTRKLIIGSIDVKTSRQLENKNQRKMERLSKKKESREIENLAELQSKDSKHIYVPDESKSDTTENSDTKSESSLNKIFASPSSQNFNSSDPQPSCSHALGADVNLQMRENLTAFARKCDRHGISDRGAASISSALLQDLGLINSIDTSKIIDRNKVRREREKHRKHLQTVKTDEITGLYFDGRKDKTRTQTKQGDKYHASIVTEEHISLVQEPGSLYLGHLTVLSGSAAVIKDNILNFFHRKALSTESLIAIGCDGTNVNTGTNAGIIRLLEIELNRPLQWFICMLHLNELPLRHLLIHLDGVTQGPKAFSGPIGKLIKISETLPLVKFSKIEGNTVPALDRNTLSTDQQYLYDMLHAVSSGECSQDLANIKPGPVIHSRWNNSK